MRAKREPTYEELKEKFFKKLWSDYYLRDPDMVLVIPVSRRVADAVRVNPESVRVVVTDEFGARLVESARANRAGVTVKVGESKECDEEGFPVWYEDPCAEEKA
jgi:hypothetical protein